MPKSLRTFLEDVKREIPDELITISKVVERVSEVKLVMNCETSRRKTQIALGLPPEWDRTQMGEECLRREEERIKPVMMDAREARPTTWWARAWSTTAHSATSISRKRRPPGW